MKYLIKIILVITIVSCGQDEGFKNSQLLFLNSFAQTQITSFTYEEASKEFKAWNRNFVIGGELFGMIRIPGISVLDRQERLVSAMESVSILANMKFNGGQYMFEDVYRVDEKGNKVDDQVDGIIGGDNEIIKINFELVSLPVIGVIHIKSEAKIQRLDNGTIRLEFYNTETIPVLVFRRFIRPMDIRLSYDYEPVNDGFVVTGKTSLMIHALDKRAKSERLEEIQKSFHEVITKKILNPAYR